MNNLSRKLLFGCLWSALLLHGPAGPAQDPEAKKNKSMLMMMMQAERPIAFYGKVIDQFNNPVEGAEVAVDVETFKFNPIAFLAGDIKTVKIKTDKNGNFFYKKRRALNLFIDGVTRAGYEYDLIRANRENSNSPDYRDGQIPKASNPATPAIFHMRKLGEQTFLLTGEGHLSIEIKESGIEKGFDVIQHTQIEGDLWKTLRWPITGEPLVPDLKARAFWDGKERTWTVELSAGTPGGGLVVADHKLYEAPAAGYQPTFTFKVRVPKDIDKELSTVILPGNPPREVRLTRENPPPDDKMLHLYLRTRQPWIYTRIEALFPSPEDNRQDWIALLRSTIMDSRNISVNPYGERNLEQAQDLPVDIRFMLKDEIDRYYRLHANGCLPKPDLVKLTQEWKKKQPLSEKLKGLFH